MKLSSGTGGWFTSGAGPVGPGHRRGPSSRSFFPTTRNSSLCLVLRLQKHPKHRPFSVTEKAGSKAASVRNFSPVEGFKLLTALAVSPSEREKPAEKQRRHTRHEDAMAETVSFAGFGGGCGSSGRRKWRKGTGCGGFAAECRSGCRTSQRRTDRDGRCEGAGRLPGPQERPHYGSNDSKPGHALGH